MICRSTEKKLVTPAGHESVHHRCPSIRIQLGMAGMSEQMRGGGVGIEGNSILGGGRGWRLGEVSGGGNCGGGGGSKGNVDWGGKVWIAVRAGRKTWVQWGVEPPEVHIEVQGSHA